MSNPETTPSSSREKLQAALFAVQRSMELNDENENPIERNARRDHLLEQQDELLQALSSILSPPSDSTS